MEAGIKRVIFTQIITYFKDIAATHVLKNNNKSYKKAPWLFARTIRYRKNHPVIAAVSQLLT